MSERMGAAPHTGLTVFGSINLDSVIGLVAIPRPGETVSGTLRMTGSGGKGANQAIAAARILEGHLPVNMVGAVGNDPAGNAALESLRRNGVATSGIRVVAGDTGSAIVMLDAGGQNAITVIAGANDTVGAEQLEIGSPGGNGILLCQGELRFEQTIAACERFKAASPGGTTIVNLAPVPAADVNQIERLLDVADVVLVNETEASTVQQVLKESLVRAAARHGTTVITTLGAQGARAELPHGEVLAAKSPEARVVDTTGAGDTFAGALAAMLALGADLQAAMEMACKCGSLSCEALGAQAGMPRGRDVLPAQFHSIGAWPDKRPVPVSSNNQI